MGEFIQAVEEYNSGTRNRTYTDRSGLGELAWRAQAAVLNFEKIDIDPPLVNDDAEYSWYHLHNSEELSALKLNLFNPDCVAFQRRVKTYPAWVLAYYNEERYGDLITSPEALREIYREYMERLDILIEDREIAACERSLWPGYIGVLKEEGWSIRSYKRDGRVELEKRSPAGEDFSMLVDTWNFPDAVADYADAFDLDKHVTNWLVAKGKGVEDVPHVKDLVEDAEAILKMILQLVEKLDAITEQRELAEKAAKMQVAKKMEDS